MRWTKNLKFGFWLASLISFLVSLPGEEWGTYSHARLAAYLFFIICYFLSLYSLRKHSFQGLAVTYLLLMGLNTPLALLTQPEFITLPHNLTRKVQIVGDVMPGFSGVETITTDQKGFRVTRNIDYDDDGTFRVFAIGGSTTEQIYLDDFQTWTHLLQEKLTTSLGTTIEVINTGVSGLRAKHHYTTFQEIRKYHPDLVIFLMGINDWGSELEDTSEDWRTFPSRINFHKTPIGRMLVSLKQIITSKPPAAVVIHMDTGDYYSSQNNSLNRKNKKSFPSNVIGSNYQYWVGKISQACREKKIRCVFVDQPHAYKPEITEVLKARLWMTPPNSPYTLTLDNLLAIANSYNTWLMSFAQDTEHLGYCELAKFIESSENYLYDDCHFNEGGAKKVADVLALCLIPQVKLAATTP